MDPMEKECKHRFKHKETSKTLGTEGRRVRYTRTDRYYCVLCTEEREISMQKLTDKKPDWY